MDPFSKIRSPAAVANMHSFVLGNTEQCLHNHMTVQGELVNFNVYIAIVCINVIICATGMNVPTYKGWYMVWLAQLKRPTVLKNTVNIIIYVVIFSEVSCDTIV